MRKISTVSLIVSLLATIGAAQARKISPTPCDPPAFHAPAAQAIDLVICLDTSGSMQGLIDSARAKLWDIVSELSNVQPTPQLRVGLLTYGSPNTSSADKGWIVRQIGLTSDLDAVYERMMAMSITGGDEFVGWVLNDAVNTMDWSPDPSALKLIFVAGNESADQAAHQANFRNVGSMAIAKGIKINAIYCGSHQQGLSEKWDQVARCGGGVFSSIDMQTATAQVATPYDDALLKLNIELNATYVPFGKEGRIGAARQISADASAESVGIASAPSRVAAKATVLYKNEKWDLVDAALDKDFKLEEIKEADLPAYMQKMAPKKRVDHLAQQRTLRARVQSKIQKVGRRRRTFLRKEKSKSSSGKQGLDEALIKTIRKQAAEKGIVIKKSN